jgi:hypothetical protein
MAEKFDGFAQQIKTVNATEVQTLIYPPGSRSVYECANPFITRGLTTGALSYEDCLANELYGSKVQDIVDNITGFNPNWSGPPSLIDQQPSEIDSPLIGEKSPECEKIESDLGASWKGCFWAAPDSIISCECPEIGSKYLDYLKLRLNVATFWNTPKETPIKRKRFLDAITYGPKVTLVVAADLKLRPGNVIDIAVNAISGYSTSTSTSSLSKKYYVLSVKSTCTNSGVGETSVTAVELLY